MTGRGESDRAASDRAAAAPQALHGPNPWSRYGWLIQSVWLVFLVFPLVAVFSLPIAGWQVVLAVLAILGFGAAYILGIRHLDRLGTACRPRYGAGALWLLALIALACATVPFIGINTTSFLPFIVAFGMFALPVGFAAIMTAIVFAGSVVAAVWFDADQGGWIVSFIVLSVGVMTGGIRLMSERSEQYRVLERELGLAAERERVARDVHDVLGHSLTVVTVKAELAERLIDLDPGRARAELADIQELSRQALAEIRETVGGLRAARLGVELAAARTALSGAGIRADVPDDVDEVDPRHRTVLAWVLREAVTNVVRHSGATTCQVELAPNRLRVADDGRGVDGNPPGNGLRGVRERVEGVGGELRVGPGHDGRGTVLEVTL